MPLHYLFVDFNSFFASVEQQVTPKLRGKPVGVVPMMAETTVCLAASYEAKKMGVKTGTMVRDARNMCPGIHIVEARHQIYVEYHHKLVEAVESCIPVDKVLSIDEMVCELSGSQRQRENAVALAHQIKKTIFSKVGAEMRCSIGIAPNPFLAKTATDMQKPDGLVVIDTNDLPDCLYKLELNDFCGIGPRMERRLRTNGINTVKQLCLADKTALRTVWGGIEGERMYKNLRGEVVQSPVTHRSTVGHSHVLPPVLRKDESACAVLHKLVQKAAMRLRSYGYLAGAMYASVRYVNGEKWSEELNFTDTQDTVQFTKAFTTMWDRKPRIKSNPMKVAVTLFKLREEKYHTVSLFDGKKRQAVNMAIDKLNLLYGKNTVYFAGAYSALNSAPMRIAFNHIPDLELEGDE